MTDDIAKNYRDIITALGEDPDREGLRDTPTRAAKAMQFLNAGYKTSLDEIINNAVFESQTDEMVLVKDIELYSMCEHHLLPFIGKCHIAYLPDGKVLGLSKFARIVDMYARRMQIQENLTREIAETVQEVTGAKGVGVVIEARHLCMMMRGVEKQNSSMTTSVMLGRFRSSQATRQEFLTLVN
ncbi:MULTISPECIES: GTP cyclohydrolase I FolE [unclassified Halomonas]|uniref:GTP cyclohydrolase I FolE n=1 Tax=unclassified Halomonas TaxID=2609666 RepID=UPI0021E4A0C5|nr:MULTISPECIES: GTP cyclohydrolase I FolE [unclassified Halomonas]UYG01559.1 GTP cyclohydrolase I FolE [Halomonas sp. GD1P12]WNL37385.1 GTP cyclohydrolase I FolE [Halomonas sp. PAMB 3232]WNL40701.1 GTP cyclohydrolase I FolE [Halomonas sp. PAMB 3264]